MNIDIILSIAVILIIYLIIYIFAKTQKTKDIKVYKLNPYKISLKQIDEMDGYEFELYVCVLLHELGYTDAYTTLGSRDYGADIIFTDSNNVRNVIQAKCYDPDNTVSLNAVQEIYASKRYYKAKKAIVLTTSFYTQPCEKLASVNGVVLLNRDDLATIIEELKKGNRFKARRILESEPMPMLETWSPSMGFKPVIKRDYTIEVPKKESL